MPKYLNITNNMKQAISVNPYKVLKERLKEEYTIWLKKSKKSKNVNYMENHPIHLLYAILELKSKKRIKTLDKILKNMTKKDVKNLYAEEYKGVPKGPWVFRITEYYPNGNEGFLYGLVLINKKFLSSNERLEGNRFNIVNINKFKIFNPNSKPFVPKSQQQGGYVKIQGGGTRKVRHQKNGKAYILLNGRKVKL